MKFITLLTVFTLTTGLALANHHEKSKKQKHDKEHQHVEKGDHDHDEAHHKKHDHKAHHPDHQDAAAPAVPAAKN